MTINPSYADLFAREMGNERLREAEKLRLIRSASSWNPSTIRKTFLIIQTHWKEFWSGVFNKRGYIPISQTQKESPSL